MSQSYIDYHQANPQPILLVGSHIQPLYNNVPFPQEYENNTHSDYLPPTQYNMYPYGYIPQGYETNTITDNPPPPTQSLMFDLENPQVYLPETKPGTTSDRKCICAIL